MVGPALSAPTGAVPWQRAILLPALGATVHLAKGFGRARRPDKRGNAPDAAADSAAIDEAAASELNRVRRSVRGKLVPCEVCRGKGKKKCQFCEGTTLMVGFLGSRVPCVPCRATGTLGRPCPECNGMGFFQP